MIEAVEFICTYIYSIFLPLLYRKQRRVVIYYHSIKSKDIGGFERQMRYLAKNYSVVKASEINTSPSAGVAVVAVTFDDAFDSIAGNALPVLKKYNLPATIFVPTGSLGRRPQWPIEKLWYPDEDEKIMSESQIAALSGNGFEFGSHTVSHTVLTKLQDGNIKDELLQSRQTLERITANGVPAVSYPLGAYNEKVCRFAGESGYEFGFTTEPYMANCSVDNLKIGRFTVKPTDGLVKFKLKVKGAYQFSRHLRSAKALFRGN